MIDYEVLRNDPFKDPFTHFTHFSYCDPVAFKDAVKESK